MQDPDFSVEDLGTKEDPAPYFDHPGAFDEDEDKKPVAEEGVEDELDDSDIEDDDEEEII